MLHRTIISLPTMWNHVLSVFRSLQPLHLRLSRRGVGFSLCGVQVRKRFFFFYILSPFPGSLLWAREQKIRRQLPFLSQQMVKSLRRVAWLQRYRFNLKVCIKHPAQHWSPTLRSISARCEQRSSIIMCFLRLAPPLLLSRFSVIFPLGETTTRCSIVILDTRTV